MAGSARHYGWAGDLATFLAIDQQVWLQELEQHHAMLMGVPSEVAQRMAWQESFAILRDQLSLLCMRRAEAHGWNVIFEYELPRERGRRPDVVLLVGSSIIVIEFKGYGSVRQAHVDQVAAYARDLQHYHAESHNRRVVPMLLQTKAAKSHGTKVGGVQVIAGCELARGLLEVVSDDAEAGPVSRETWLQASYEPLPTIVQAAQAIFDNEPLPQIRRVASAGTGEAVERLLEIARQAYNTGGQYLVLIAGVPGAGKTLTGLQFVYKVNRKERFGVFLSGNGPLISVLRDAFGQVYVQGVHDFLQSHGGDGGLRFREHIFVYDEAQRAWDAAQTQRKRRDALSEPHEFVRLGERIPGWSMLVGLIGEGQEIYVGEEGGLDQWNEAIRAVGTPWTVFCSAHQALAFSAPNATVVQDERLNLTASLRSHLAEDVQRWVAHVVAGELAQAAKLAPRIEAQGFDLYVTRQLPQARQYVVERYAGEESKRYGLLMSSQANMPRMEEVPTRDIGRWFNAPAMHKASCCQLERVATEFQCQGLELDFPVVIWGTDLQWNKRLAAWTVVARPDGRLRDPRQLRRNSYRVLLSRGRDGLLVVVPEAAHDRLVETYEALQAAGMRVLSVGGAR